MRKSKIESFVAFIIGSRKVSTSLRVSHLLPPRFTDSREHISTTDISRHSQGVPIAPDVEELGSDKEKEVVGTNGEEDLVASSVHRLILFAVDLLVASAGTHRWDASLYSHSARLDYSPARTCCIVQMQQSSF